MNNFTYNFTSRIMICNVKCIGFCDFGGKIYFNFDQSIARKCLKWIVFRLDYPLISFELLNCDWNLIR